MLKLLVVLVVAATLCSSQDPGDYDYIACNDCQIPEGEFPQEGHMACYSIKTEMKLVKGREWKCRRTKVCSDFDFFCVPSREKCSWEEATIAVPSCKLQRISCKPIEHRDYFYQIYSPQYHGYYDYPNNTYCAWNVADTGYVSYQIIDQQLQEPLDCNATGCNCPDTVKISKGESEHILCGTNKHSLLPGVSSNGLHVKICSDNKHTAKGFMLIANDLSLDLNKTETTVLKDQEMNETYNGSCREHDNFMCHYKYMMAHISQPDSPCPDDATVKTTLQYHNHLMSSIPSQPQNYDGKCNETTYSSRVMPTMNKIEICAMEYLNHTRDCVFASTLVNSNSTISELRGFARAVVENDVETIKRMGIRRRKRKVRREN